MLQTLAVEPSHDIAASSVGGRMCIHDTMSPLCPYCLVNIWCLPAIITCRQRGS